MILLHSINRSVLSIRGYIIVSVAVVAVFALPSCGVKDSAPDSYDQPWDKIANAVPKKEAKSRYGNPASYEVFGERYYVRDSSAGFTQEGIASWYGTKFHGERTSSGEEYNMYAMTAAHKTLPLPTYVEVINKENGRRAVVKVNDRGPFHDGRIIDLSYAAATRLGVDKTGTAKVKIRALDPGKSHATHAGSVDGEYASNDGKVYVQVAAFATEAKAFDMLSKLREANFSGSRIHVDKQKGRTLYRVRIGPLPSTDVAKKLLTQLQDIKQKNAKIVTYN
jgi:rare lipoprotein A